METESQRENVNVDDDEMRHLMCCHLLWRTKVCFTFCWSPLCLPALIKVDFYNLLQLQLLPSPASSLLLPLALLSQSRS